MKKKPLKEDLDIIPYKDKFRIKYRSRILWIFSSWVELEYTGEDEKNHPIELDTLNEAFEFVENISR